MKIKGKLLGLLVAGSLVLGTTGALAADSMAQNRANTATNYSAKKVVNIQTKISLEKAKQIALKDAKSGNVTSAHLDKENGIWVFEVEVVDGNIEKDYTIDANSGKILDIEIEIDRNLYVPKKSNPAKEAKVSMDKAKEIALKAAKAGKVTKVELDRDYGILVYEIEVRDARVEKDYKINALTGEIVKSEVDMDDDFYDDDRFDDDDDDRFDYDDDRFDYDDDRFDYDDDRFDYDDDRFEYDDDRFDDDDDDRYDD